MRNFAAEQERPMTQIIDVSPTKSNMLTDANHSVIGRMLSIASSPDREVLFAGSYSNLWNSFDDGQNWDQCREDGSARR